MPDRPPSRAVTRRAVLRWGVGGGALAAGLTLAGCGVRIDDGATVPFLTRQRMADEDILLAAYRREVVLVRLTGAATDPDPATVALVRSAAPRHTEHAAAVRAILVAGGVPDHLIDPPTSTGSATGSQTGSTTPPPPVPATVAAIRDAALEAAGPAATSAVDRATTDHALVLASVAAHAAVLAASLGGPPPSSPALPASAAAALLPPTRAAAYAVEVAAARIPAADRTRALATVAWLRARERDWVTAAGPLAPLPDLGFRLPGPVASPAEATASIGAALAGLVAVGLSPLATSDRPAGMAGAVVSAHVETIRHAMTWGVPLSAFPGLARP